MDRTKIDTTNLLQLDIATIRCFSLKLLLLIGMTDIRVSTVGLKPYDYYIWLKLDTKIIFS